MPDWHPEDVKAALRKRGITIAKLARTTGVSASSLYQSIERRASEPAERAIAKALGLPAHQIWPSRYHGTQRIHLVERRTGSRAAA